jgi:Protein of unknown function (DUF3014)
MGTVATDMAEVPDFELVKTEDERSALGPRAGRSWTWIVAALVIAGCAAAGYFWFRSRPSAAVSNETRKSVEVSQRQLPLGGEPEPIEVPPLDASDAVVRELVARLSSHPAVAAWLTTDGLVRNFAVVVANIAEARTPAVHLKALRPSTGFQVVKRDDALYIDPRSYERYDRVAAAAASIDPAGAARVYATLKPRIEEAYRELGAPDGTFDRALERAIVVLLKTPVVDHAVRVEAQGGTGFGYAAPDLEALSAPQKQLLRAGPRNVRAIQSALRAIAIALGIPEERLPQPTSR